MGKHKSLGSRSLSTAGSDMSKFMAWHQNMNLCQTFSQNPNHYNLSSSFNECHLFPSLLTVIW